MRTERFVLGCVWVMSLAALGCDPKEPAVGQGSTGPASGGDGSTPPVEGREAPDEKPAVDDGVARFEKSQMGQFCERFTVELVAKVTGIDAGQWRSQLDPRSCRYYTESGATASLNFAVKKDVEIAKRVFAENVKPKDVPAEVAKKAAEAQGGLAKQGLDAQQQGQGMAMGGASVADLQVASGYVKVAGLGHEAVFDTSVKDVSLMGQTQKSPANTVSVRVSNAIFSVYVAKDPTKQDKALVESLTRSFLEALP